MRPTNLSIFASAFSRKGFVAATFFRSAIRFFASAAGWVLPSRNFSRTVPKVCWRRIAKPILRPVGSLSGQRTEFTVDLAVVVAVLRE